MSKRPPNELEIRLHQAALASSKKELSNKDAAAIIPDPTARQNALNFLLTAGLLKPLTNAAGQVSFRVVGKEELTATKGLTGEENLVLGHIKSAGNEGIWLKHIKAKTSLHQTVIDRCLKILTQKRLIKRVQSVQHITRKIYMLEGIEPSIALTGGPWYTDNELDTEFIQHLTEACYKLISDTSFPKRRNDNERVLYPLSNSPKYPTARDIRESLKKARLTETELTVEHVEMLLNVLILDGKIEKLPSFGPSLWDPDALADDVDSDRESSKSRKKRKNPEPSDDEEPSTSKKKRKKPLPVDSDSSDDDESSAKKAKRKRSRSRQDSDDDRKSRKKKKKRDVTDSDSSSSSEDNRRKKKKSKKVKTEPSDDESETASERHMSKRSTKRDNSSSPAPFMDYDMGGNVYRALKEYKASLGIMETPCGPCPSFQFCKPGGPVNPQECVYYGDWLDEPTLKIDVEGL